MRQSFREMVGDATRISGFHQSRMKPLKRVLGKKLCTYTFDSTIPSTSVRVGTGVPAMTKSTTIKGVDPVLPPNKVFTRWIKTVIHAFLDTLAGEQHPPLETVFPHLTEKVDEP